MDARIKKLWVDALRSGEYNQVKGQMRGHYDGNGYGGGYCCLAVLCDIHAKEEGRPYAFRSTWETYKWAGLDIRKDKVIIDGVSDQLHHHNDSGKTFAQIADAIETDL